MKKILIIVMFLSLIIARPSQADETNAGTGGIEDSMPYGDTFDNPFAGQKQISDEDFQKTLKSVKDKQNKKKKAVKPFKGQNFNGENNGGYLDETAEKTIILGVPLNLINGDGTEIPTGHYKIVGEKDKDKVFLNFYQSYTLIAKVPAIETNNDFNEPTINFVKLLPYNEKRIKIIYGSLDFNAYTFINIRKEISDTN